VQGWWAASYVVLWVLVIFLCFVVVALARQIGTLHLRLGPRGALEMDDEGPPLGESLAPVAARDLAGRDVVVGGPGRPQLLLFVSPGCRMCEEVLPSLPVIARDGAMSPYVLTDSDPEEARLAFGERRLKAPVVPSLEAAQAYAVPGTPYVIATDGSGVVVGKGTVNTLEQMEGLIETARQRAGDTRERTPI
jgi:methylamine dehydrogenase accessory protein MauD